MRGKGEGTVKALPSGKWQARATVGLLPSGHPRRVTRSFSTKRDALRWLQDVAARLQAGTLSDSGKVTLGEWAAEYLASLTIRPNTRHDYEQALAPALARFGQLRLRDLTPAMVQAALNGWSRERTPYQNRKTLSRLRAVLEGAVRLELLARNPAAPIKLPRVERAQILVLTAQQAAQLLRRAHETGHRLSAYVHVNLTTGLRREEMFGLRWQDLDLGGGVGTLHVRQTCVYVAGKPHFGPPKTRAGRRSLALDAGTIAALRGWAERQRLERRVAGESWVEHDLVFASRLGKPVAESRFAKTFRELLALAGVPRVRLYDLRHTYASIAYEKGVPVKLIGERLGHTSVAFTLQTYVHAGEDQRRNAALGAADLYGLDLLSASSAIHLPRGRKKERGAS